MKCSPLKSGKFLFESNPFADFNTRPERIHPGAAKLLFRTGFSRRSSARAPQHFTTKNGYLRLSRLILKLNKSFPRGHFRKAQIL